jgi:ABC-2 type transport system permease protein
MRNFLSLLKLQINAQYGLSYALYNFKNDKKTLWKGIGIGVAILLSLGQIVGLYSFLMVQLYKTATSLFVPQLILTIAVVISGLFVLVFGIFYILSTLFLAKDTELLASMPIPQGSVFVSKFMLVLLGEYPFAFFLMLPPVIIYGVGTHKSVLYYIIAIFCTLFIPLIPLIISAILSLLLMNFVSRSRRRDLITIIGSIILMIVIIGGQNYLMSRMPENGQDIMLEILKSSTVLVDVVGKAFPPAIWITNVLSLGGLDSLMNLLYLILTSAGAFAVVYLIASIIYQRGALAQLETQSKPGKAKLNYESSSHIVTIFKTELRGVVRTPIYALNSLVMVFVAPLMMMLPMFGGNFTSDPDIKFLFNLIQSGESQAELLLIVAGVITLLTLINPAASSTFSREGKCFWILKNIPVKPEIQVYGKLLAGYFISFIAAVLTSVMAMLSFKLSPVLTLMIIILSSLALIPISIWNIFIDLIRPKLTWNSPTEAIKQNFNVVIGMLIGFLLVFVFGVAGYFINNLNLNVYTVFSIMAMIFILVSYISFVLLRKASQKAYQKIEA